MGLSIKQRRRWDWKATRIIFSKKEHRKIRLPEIHNNFKSFSKFRFLHMKGNVRNSLFINISNNLITNFCLYINMQCHGVIIIIIIVSPSIRNDKVPSNGASHELFQFTSSILRDSCVSEIVIGF